MAHVIHRHGMNDETALAVEGALLDAYSGLTNIAGGHGNSDFGAMHALEIIQRYRATPAVFKHRAILINTSRSATETSIYEGVRFAWKIGRKGAEQAEVVLAPLQGLIVGAFVPSQWLDAKPENFPGRPLRPGRIGFAGEEAPADIRSLYIRKQVPQSFRPKGAANPVRYTWGRKTEAVDS